MGRLDLPGPRRDEDDSGARPRLELASCAFNRPWLIAEQIRLLRKYLDENFGYVVIDASDDTAAANEIRAICEARHVGYLRSPSREHSESLNFARDHLLGTEAPYVGFLDHDVFPTRRTRLIPRIDDAGFLGLGQRYKATDRQYLWPGFAFFATAWLGGRLPDFGGIRGGTREGDGDTGSAMWPLFAPEDWQRMWRIPHGYEAIRDDDGHGIQSYGYERLGSFVHLTNGSDWKRVPNADEREALFRAMLAAL